jgi:hypothetical protein
VSVVSFSFLFQRFSDLIQMDGAVQKEYVALVHGLFSDEMVRVEKPIRVFGRHSGGVCGVDVENVCGKLQMCVFF